jgi:hypothetical protein
MKAKRKKLIIISLTAICIFIFTALSLWIYWETRLEKAFLVKKTRHHNMKQIFYGIAEFNTRKGRLPHNLHEVVAAGYLPKLSKIYSCPMKHHTLFDKEIPFTECEYEFSFEPNEVYIYIPEDVFNQKRFKGLYDNSRWLVVTEDIKLMLDWPKKGE